MCEKPISAADPTPRQSWIRLCDTAQVKAKTIMCARAEGRDILLIWNEGTVVACERRCPHEQADLGRGHVTDGRLFCPRHAASFDLGSGTISFGWPSRDLRLYPVRIADDHVHVRREADQ